MTLQKATQPCDRLLGFIPKKEDDSNFEIFSLANDVRATLYQQMSTVRCPKKINTL